MSCQSFSTQSEMIQPTSAVFAPLEIDGPERWMIRDRLLDLGISASCSMGQPLRVEVATPYALVQCWAVMRSYREARLNLIDGLEGCLELPAFK